MYSSPPIGELDGRWVNNDRRWEEYVVSGREVTRTDRLGSRKFSIQWDPARACWQWGVRGRLVLQWLGNDAIAWVPDTSYENPIVWRWQRIRPFGSSRSLERTQTRFRGGRPQGRQSSRSRSRSRSHRRHRHRHHGHYHSRRNVTRTQEIMPCGLTNSEVYDLFSRELTPEDYDMLLRLDESVPKSKGCDANCIDALPRVACDEFKGEDCRVCLTSFENDDDVVALPCGHHFHASCISTWLSDYRKACPLCNREIHL